ncbi:hypothetical protein CKA32_004425 [Geitlerinema sp. FC II]|nr:hypothetical protein CKA32_004425 [Geitlerinema sp. FC II]
MLEDRAHVRHLERPPELDAEKADAHVEDLEKTKLFFIGLTHENWA